MTDLLDVSAGRIVIRDTSGATRFDSNEKLFYAVERVRSSVTIPARAASFLNGTYSDARIDTEHVLKSINVGCDTVVGAFKVTTTSGYGVANLGWNNASGTYLHYFDDLNPSDRIRYVANAVSFTFRARSGQLVLHERTILRAMFNFSTTITNTITVPSITFDYNLYVGAFI